MGTDAMKEDGSITLGRSYVNYFFAIDAFNVIDNICDIELKAVFSGKPVIIFIDCYDLIDYMFEKDQLLLDKHYDQINSLWNEVFSLIRPDDPIKIAISPPTALELFHFLQGKANFIHKRMPKIVSGTDMNLDTYFSKVKMALLALSFTEDLVDEAKGQIPQFEKLHTLISQGKLVSANTVFDYNEINKGSFLSTVSKLYDREGAYRFLMSQRQSYRTSMKKDKGQQESFLNLGLDNFTVLTDINNIAQTIFIDQSDSDKIYKLNSHGIFTLLCCNKQLGTWRGPERNEPVRNSLAALYLTRALRSSNSYNDAADFLRAAKGALRNYLTELIRLPAVRQYIDSSQKTREARAFETVEKSRGFTHVEYSLKEYYGDIFLQRQPRAKSKTDISLTRAQEAAEFSRDKTARKKRADKIRKAATVSVTKIVDFTQISEEIFVPPDDHTKKLLLSLKGYSTSQWR